MKSNIILILVLFTIHIFCWLKGLNYIQRIVIKLSTIFNGFLLTIYITLIKLIIELTNILIY